MIKHAARRHRVLVLILNRFLGGTYENSGADPAAPDQLFAVGKALYELNKSTGLASQVGGAFNKFWAMAGIPVPSDVVFTDGFETGMMSN